MKPIKFAIIGGDGRNIALAKILKAHGHTVRLFGFSFYEKNYEKENLETCKNLYEAVDGADYIIGPTPLSYNGHIMNTVLNDREINIEDLFKIMNPKQIFFAGYIKDEAIKSAGKYETRIIDLLKREELLVLNAIPTALQIGDNKKPTIIAVNIICKPLPVFYGNFTKQNFA